MIALDASAVVEILRGGALADSLRRDLLESGLPFIAPHLVDVEAMSALRRLAAERRIDPHRIQQYLETLEVLPAKRYEHTPLLGRIWEYSIISRPTMRPILP